MKKAIGIVLGCSLLAGACNQGWAEELSQPLTILQKAIRAAGGEENLKSVPAVIVKGKGYSYPDAEGSKLAFHWEAASEPPQRERFVYEMTTEGKKERFVLAVEGSKGWMTTNGTAQKMPTNLLEAQRQRLYIESLAHLLPLRGKDFHLTDLGEIRIKDRPVVGIKAARKGHPDVSLFFDQKTHLLTALKTSVRDEPRAAEVKMEVYFAHYKNVAGVWSATETTVFHDGRLSMKLEAADIQRTSSLADHLFKK